METINLTERKEEAIARASEVLLSGGVILYPTDTLYALGADAHSESALSKVYAIKTRDIQKPFHAIVSDLEMASKYAEVNDAARTLAARFLPGPLTLILHKRPDVEIAMSKGRDEFAIRIPKQDFCLELARTFNNPYTTTSANLSGATTATSVKEILAQLGENASLIDLVIDAGILPACLPSTVVSVVSGYPSVLRQGAIPAASITA